MSPVDYRAAMDQVSLACRLLLGLDEMLDACLATVEQADVLGPVLDPTSYGAGGARNLADARSVLGPAISLRDAARTIDPGRLVAPT